MHTQNEQGAAANANQLQSQIKNELDALYSEDFFEQLTLDGFAKYDDPEEFLSQTSAEIYQLASGKMQQLRRKIERRACKNAVSDRRASLRLDENGEPQRDRRALNRTANFEAIQQHLMRQTTDS
jgi:hypothetical protein